MSINARDIFDVADKQYKDTIRIVRPGNNKSKISASKPNVDDIIKKIIGNSNPVKFDTSVKKDAPSKGTTIGEFVVTDDFGEKERLKKEEKKRKKYEADKKYAYELLAKKEFILKKLATLNIRHKDDVKKIAKLNHKLEMIDWELNKLKEEHNFNYMKLQKGSRIQRLVAYVNKKFNTVKKFINKNWSTIKTILVGIATVVIPPIISSVFGKRNNANTQPA